MSTSSEADDESVSALEEPSLCGTHRSSARDESRANSPAKSLLLHANAEVVLGTNPHNLKQNPRFTKRKIPKFNPQNYFPLRFRLNQLSIKIYIFSIG